MPSEEIVAVYEEWKILLKSILTNWIKIDLIGRISRDFKFNLTDESISHSLTYELAFAQTLH